ncbi:uncharacterized protein KY384_004764 [Bacidia gigantensis]|uniref:uncharacterized protein n=1 Tax=Bacidia gigantensis TaxID=2732470 RepID=UPI001D036C9B|nr:uncharacterized protein KY384_004764 [Bacidia gigantensis]KAG8530263.1 hypothetical protein KY384_004764 [Bacidia gigantensis]
MASSSPSPDLWMSAVSQLKPQYPTLLGDLRPFAKAIGPQSVISAVEEEQEKVKRRQWESKGRDGKEAIVLRDIFANITSWVQ